MSRNRLITGLLISSLLFTLIGCGADENVPPSPEASPSENTVSVSEDTISQNETEEVQEEVPYYMEFVTDNVLSDVSYEDGLLNELVSSPALREAIEAYLGISTDDGKTGIFYVDSEGKHTDELSLRSLLHNKAFASYLSDELFAAAISDCYTDINDTNTAVAIGLSEYFGILPDSEEGVSNSGAYVSRQQILDTAEKAEGSDAADGDVADNSFLAGDELTDEALSSAITEGEAVYFLITRYFPDEYSACADDTSVGSTIPESIRKALIIAKDKGIISNYTSAKDYLTKGKALKLFVDVYSMEEGLDTFEYTIASEDEKPASSDTAAAAPATPAPATPAPATPTPAPATPAPAPSTTTLNSVPAQGGCNIDNVSSLAAIEGDITVNGSGTGCFAKFVICTPTSAISLGLQYDQYGNPPYTGKTMVMMENVMSNAAGGQVYVRPGNIEVQKGQTVHVMLTLNSDGTGNAYVNGTLVGSFNNPGLANQTVYCRVEGCARKEGDTVQATFKNLRIRNADKADPAYAWHTYEFQTCPTISNTTYAWNDIYISGYISGLTAAQDWDSAFGQVSDVIQFF